MFCMKCGTALPDDACFCYSCGSQIDIQALRALNGDGQAAPALVNSPTPANPGSSVKSDGKCNNKAISGESLGYEYYNWFSFDYRHFSYADDYNNEIYTIKGDRDSKINSIKVHTMNGEVSREIILDTQPKAGLNTMAVNECGIFIHGAVDGDICVYKYSYEGKLIKNVTINKPSKFLDFPDFSPSACLTEIRICGNRFAYAFNLDGENESGSAMVGVYSFDDDSKSVITKTASFASLHSFYNNYLCVKLCFYSEITDEDIEVLPKLDDDYYAGYEIGDLEDYYVIDLEKKYVFDLSCNLSAFSLFKNRKKYLEDLANIGIERTKIFSVHLKEKIIWVEKNEGEKKYLKPVELVLKNGAALGSQSKRFPVFDITELYGIWYFDGKKIIRNSDQRNLEFKEYIAHGLYSQYIRYSHTCGVGAELFRVAGDILYSPYCGDLNVLKRTPGQYTPVKFAEGICWAD